MLVFGFLMMIMGAAIMYWAATPGGQSATPQQLAPSGVPGGFFSPLASIPILSTDWNAVTNRAQTQNVLGYAIGNCTAFVAAAFSWVGAWGNAGQWLDRARASGYQTTNVPTVGSIAVWGGGMGGADPLGHVAIVTGIQSNGLPIVRGMTNYQASVANVSPYSASGIIGYILPPARR